MTLIDGDRIVTVNLYDDQHEEFTEKKMSIIDYINAYTDEGVTVADVVEQSRWIPVSERLPEIHNYSKNYFVTLKRGGVRIAMFTECDGKHWWTYDDVIAWMLLPVPYESHESEVKV